MEYFERYESFVYDSSDLLIVVQASSLRTTLATSALSLISELSVALGPSLDFLLEPLLSHCLSMAGQTKKIVATASQSAVTNLISNSAYHLKTLQLLWLGMNDKIVLARTFVSAHVITFIKIHGERSKSTIESSGGLEILAQCLSKGLVDPNPIVKENTRIAFWESSKIWTSMTDKILAGLDSSTLKALEKVDPSKKVIAAATVVKVGRPSMREQMLAKKAALERVEPIASGSKSPPPLLSRSPPPAQPRPLKARSSTSPQAPSPSRLPTLSPPRSVSKPVLSTVIRSPPRQKEMTPKAKGPSKKEEFGGDLMSLASPFRLEDRDDASLDFSHSQSTEEDVIYPRKVSLEPIDASLRAQADQAIQAAERLVEMAEEDGILVESLGTEKNGNGNKKSALNMFRTPLGKKGPLAGMRRNEILVDSPDQKGAASSGLIGKRNWWMKKSERSLLFFGFAGFLTNCLIRITASSDSAT